MLKGHINNLYNTTFWTLIQKGGMDAQDAEKRLAVSSPEIWKGSRADQYRAHCRQKRTRYYSASLVSTIITSRR